MTSKDPTSPHPPSRDLPPPPGGPGPSETDRYRGLVENAADGVFEIDADGRFVFSNHAFCRLLGRPREEILGAGFRDFMAETSADAAGKEFDRALRSGKDRTSLVWEVETGDGRARVLETTAGIVRSETGEPVGLRGICRDVTRHHEAEENARKARWLAECQYEASRKAEYRYRAFLDFLPDPVFVFNMDGTVSYLNPAFEQVFGWKLTELEGRRIPFVPEHLREETREGFRRMFEERRVHGLHTQRLTRDGRILDIILDGAIFYDETGEPAGQVVTLRDVTREKRIERVNQTLFRIARALYQHRRLDDRLEFIARQVQEILDVEGAFVILLDKETEEFFFRVVALEDSETGRRMREIRFPADKGVAGEVYRTGKPLMVPDTRRSPHYFQAVDTQAGYRTRSMLDVPIRVDDRFVGVLCAVNKKNASFDDEDVELLSTIASLVGFPVENARINDELKRSYDDVRSLNQAKDRVIHHLSHELKTPVSVLSASMELLRKRLGGSSDPSVGRILERAQRNLQRILDMQYEIEDILRVRDYKSYPMLSILLDACTDELEALVSRNLGEEDILARIREQVEELFGPREAVPEEIPLDRFAAEELDRLRPRFEHRRIRLEADFEPVPAVWIPRGVLAKVFEGLLRNAVENTPDGSTVEVRVRGGPAGPRLVVRDHGTGISEENQRLIFENYFTSYDTLQYASRRPYDFNAGGKGFDLLRMKIFSERYRFRIHMESRRCPVLAKGTAPCPGSAADCAPDRTVDDCLHLGGTTMTVQFSDAESLKNEASGEAANAGPTGAGLSGP